MTVLASRSHLLTTRVDCAPRCSTKEASRSTAVASDLPLGRAVLALATAVALFWSSKQQVDKLILTGCTMAVLWLYYGCMEYYFVE